MPENEITKIVIVEDKVIVEHKSVEKIVPVHKKQLLTYLDWLTRSWGFADKGWHFSGCQ